MAYNKQEFVDGQILKAEHLNHMEEGIQEAVDFRPLRPLEGYTINIDDLEEGILYYAPDKGLPYDIKFSRPSVSSGISYVVWNRRSVPFYGLLTVTKQVDSADYEESISVQDAAHHAYIRITQGIAYVLPPEPISGAPFVYENALDSEINKTVSEAIETFSSTYISPNSDWGQNDSNAAGFIKGRTHYEEVDPESATDTLTWDGVIGDKLAIPMDEEGATYIVHISDAVPTEADLIGGRITVSAPDEGFMPMEITSDMLVVGDAGEIEITNGDIPFITILPTALTEDGVEVVPAGIYFLFMSGSVYVSELVCATQVFGTKIVHTLPEKYIPEMSSVTLISPNGTRFKVTVNDSGALTATEITG